MLFIWSFDSILRTNDIDAKPRAEHEVKVEDDSDDNETVAEDEEEHSENDLIPVIGIPFICWQLQIAENNLIIYYAYW